MATCEGRWRPMRWVGMGAVIAIPISFLDGIDRFAQLGQVLALHVAALFGLGAWLWRGRWRPSPLVLPALVFWFLGAVSILRAHTPVASVLPLATHLAGMLFFFALLNALDEADLDAVLAAACVVAAALSVLGLLQFLGVGSAWAPTAGLPSATLGHRNLAAAYVVGLLPMTGWLFFRARTRFWTIFWSGVAGLQLSFLLATRSRAAWVGLAAGLLVGVMVMLSGGVSLRPLFRPFRLLGGAVATLIVLGFSLVPADIHKGAGEAMWEHKTHLGDAVVSMVQSGGDKGRWPLWRNTLWMISDYPVTGVGLGNWALMYPAYGELPDLHTVALRPHNDFLWVWAEMGTPGLLAYGSLIGAALWLGWLGRGVLRQVGLVGGLVAAVVTGAFGFSLQFPGAWLPFYLALAGLGIGRGDATRPMGGVQWGVWMGIALVVMSGWGVIRHIGFDKHMLQTRVAFAQNRWEEVVRHANAALFWGHLDWEVFSMRGRAHEALLAPEKALADYRAGMQYHPHSVGLWNGVGNALMALRDLEGAHHAYRQALHLSPRVGETLNNMGMLYVRKGHLDSAVVAFERAIQAQPRLVGAHANLSILYRRQGDLPGALEAAQRGLEVDSKHLESLLAKGQAHMAARQFQEAEGVFAQARALYPDRPEALFSLAQVYDAQHRADVAASAYAQFLQRWGNMPQAVMAQRRLMALTAGKATMDDGQ